MAYYNIVKRKHLARWFKLKVGGTKRAAELEESGIPSSGDTGGITVRDLLYKYIHTIPT
ncbi:integrase [Xenorhabdus budapestensis]|uniref:Integrase n=1 Tax=Xenorhabdus budapestensis TaxID=290110 RepID=A0A2D0IQK5_XENBU|nr:integrase [Xenorhabdus budapestensis]